MRWLNVEVECGGQAPPNGLIVSNHLSYLDILVFSALAPCTFVAKHEVKSWPGVGWIATLSGAIYIDRSRRSETHTVQPQLRNRLATGERVVLFPEGTSSDGKEILPFRPSLLQQAVADQTRITAACISYGLDHGDPSVDVCYYADMVLLPHAARLFAKTGVRAYVRFGETARTFNSRKEAARGLFEEVKSLKDQPAAAISRAATAVV